MAAKDTTDPRVLLTEALALEPSTGPWKVEAGPMGENWAICFLGTSLLDGGPYAVTTDGVRASEFDGDAQQDAAWMVWCRNNWRFILTALERAAMPKETP